MLQGNLECCIVGLAKNIEEKKRINKGVWEKKKKIRSDKVEHGSWESGPVRSHSRGFRGVRKAALEWEPKVQSYNMPKHR